MSSLDISRFAPMTPGQIATYRTLFGNMSSASMEAASAINSMSQTISNVTQTIRVESAPESLTPQNTSDHTAWTWRDWVLAPSESSTPPATSGVWLVDEGAGLTDISAATAPNTEGYGIIDWTATTPSPPASATQSSAPRRPYPEFRKNTDLVRSHRPSYNQRHGGGWSYLIVDEKWWHPESIDYDLGYWILDTLHVRPENVQIVPQVFALNFKAYIEPESGYFEWPEETNFDTLFYLLAMRAERTGGRNDLSLWGSDGWGKNGRDYRHFKEAYVNRML